MVPTEDGDEENEEVPGGDNDREEDNEFVADYRKKAQAQSKGHHEIVDKNHHMPHQVREWVCLW